jgi:hypothetical protein
MIDKSKTYRTRDGREVRIYATDEGCGVASVHGAIKTKDGVWHVYSWSEDGLSIFGRERDEDLIEVRPRHKRTVWLAVYPNGYIEATSKLEWRNGPCINGPYDGEKPIACIKVDLDFEEGEGL